jgi:hypothetical protein
MLTDADRVDGFRRAIEAVVRPGDVVVDLGAGTGVLSLFAARAGARRVYAIDYGKISEVSRALIADSPYRDVIEVVRGRIEQVELPERANVAIAEVIGNYVVEEDIEPIIASARSRLLVPDARVIPGAVELAAVPIELSPELARRFDLASFEGFDFSRLSRALENELFFAAHVEVLESAALAPAAVLWRAAPDRIPNTSDCRLVASRAGRLSGLALLIGAELAPGISIATRLGRHSHWSLPILPVTGAPLLAAGDQIDASIELDRSGIWSWRVTWSRDGRQLGETLQARSFQQRLLGVPVAPD